MRRGDGSSTRRAGETETSGDEERLTEVEEQAAALRRRRDELDSKAERWRRERDRLNESTRSLRAEALKHREERDQANQRVAEIKRRIESLYNELDAKRGRLAEIDVGLEEWRRRLPSRQDVEERLRRIEWEMMTTPTADILDREETLLEETRGLRRTLAAHEKLDAQKDERLRMLADIKATELKIRGCRDEISRLHGTSEENHKKMILLHRRANEERGHADDAHARFLESLSAVRELDEELRKVAGEAGRLRERLKEAERRAAAEKERRVEARRRELLAEARRKLEAGEKLSLEELKLLYREDEEIGE